MSGIEILAWGTMAVICLPVYFMLVSLALGVLRCLAEFTLELARKIRKALK